MAGDYRETSLLGRGAMGEVRLAEDLSLGREVALKRLLERYADDPERRRRFVAEARLTAQLDHPRIVPVYTLSAAEGEVPSYAMKPVHGLTLKAWLAPIVARAEARQAQPPETTLSARLELFCALCEPLAFAHRKGVVHRDVKPDNIMVGRDGDVYVMDWGVACVRRSAEAEQSVTADGFDEPGESVGTPSYMSPEQAHGDNDAIDGRSDQFALGLILSELATLRRARRTIQGGGIPMLAAALRGHLDALEPRGEPLSRELRAVIKKATATAREDRYRSVGALVTEVRRVLRGEAVAAAPDGLFQRLGRHIAAHRERVAVGLAGLFLLGAAALGTLATLALLWRDVERTEAAARADTRLALQGFADERARALDRTLGTSEGLLRGLGSSATAALRRLDGRAVVYLPEVWSEPGIGPPDLSRSLVYGGLASFLHPDLVTAPGFDRRAGAATLTTLAALRDDLADALLDSGSGAPGAAPREQVLDHGTLAIWAYVATADGALAGFPGTSSYPPDYDPRTRPWYVETLARSGPGWGRPYVDESGMGLLLTCGMPLFDRDGSVLGVAALDLTVRRLVDAWLDPGRRPGEVFLIDDTGRVVVRSGAGNTTAALAFVPFPYPEALPEVWGSPSGQVTVDGRLVVWSRLQSVDWTYLLVGNEAALIGE